MMSFFKLTMRGANAIRDTVGRILVVEGTVDCIKHYVEQVDQDGAQQLETECFLLSEIINIVSFGIYWTAL